MTTNATQDALAAAAQMAAAGKHEPALALLDTVPQDLAVPARLLRAKIFAQQRRYDQAISQWEQVLDQEPDNAEALAGIATADKLKGRTALAETFFLRANLIHAALVLIIVGLVVALMASSGGEASREITAVEALQQAQANQNELTLGLAKTLRDAVTSTDERTSHSIQILQGNIADKAATEAQRHRELTQLVQSYTERFGAVNDALAGLEESADTITSLTEKAQRTSDALLTGQGITRQAITNAVDNVYVRTQATHKQAMDQQIKLARDNMALLIARCDMLTEKIVKLAQRSLEVADASARNEARYAETARLLREAEAALHRAKADKMRIENEILDAQMVGPVQPQQRVTDSRHR